MMVIHETRNAAGMILEFMRRAKGIGQYAHVNFELNQAILHIVETDARVPSVVLGAEWASEQTVMDELIKLPLEDLAIILGRPLHTPSGDLLRLRCSVCKQPAKQLTYLSDDGPSYEDNALSICEDCLRQAYHELKGSAYL